MCLGVVPFLTFDDEAAANTYLASAEIIVHMTILDTLCGLDVLPVAEPLSGQFLDASVRDNLTLADGISSLLWNISIRHRRCVTLSRSTTDRRASFLARYSTWSCPWCTPSARARS